MGPSSSTVAGAPRRQSAGSRVGALAAALLLPACWSVTPLQGPPAPGTRIVAGLTREGSLALEDMMGADIARVEALAEDVDADRWGLLMERAWDRSGREFPWSGERVDIPAGFLLDAKAKELSRRRSWLTGGAIVAGIVLVGRAFVKGFLGGGDGGGPEPPVM